MTLIVRMSGTALHIIAHGIDWSYDFGKVTFGAAFVYSYVLILPLVFWGTPYVYHLLISNSLLGYLLWMDIPMTLVEVLCIYGYSLFVYLPAAVRSSFSFHLSFC